MLKKCAKCDGRLKNVEGGRVTFSLKNPGRVSVKADFQQCVKCGEKFFDDKQARLVARALDARA